MDLRLALEALREEFDRALEEHPIVPLGIEIRLDDITPVGAYERLVGDGRGFLFESVDEGRRFGRYSFVGFDHLGVATWEGGRPHQSGDIDIVNDDPFATLDDILTSGHVAPAVGPVAPDLPLLSGAVYALGWESIRFLETLPPRRPGGQEVPDAVLIKLGDLAIFDHWRQSVSLVTHITRGGGANFEDAVSHLQDIVERLVAPHGATATQMPSRELSFPDSALPDGEFLEMVATARDHIWKGDIFQVVLSQPFPVGAVRAPFDVYRSLRVTNPSSYLYFIAEAGIYVCGSSPEALVTVKGRRVTTRPIAGSRPRSSNEDVSAQRAEDLRRDPKEIAEHVMLVDLGRNDVGRVSRYGSVHVDELMTIEMYSHIMHMTSSVSGELRDDVSAVDALRATFPAGTLSGAPKVRAMEIITALESVPRGLYGGVVGYGDTRGNLDAAICIRTLIVDSDGQGVVRAGAGIVWDSDPQREDEECSAKAAAVIQAVRSVQSDA
jgi:anthranilate synthase component 1